MATPSAGPRGLASTRETGANVQSVARTLDILELLGTTDRPLGVVAIAEAVGLPQGTAHRLLQTVLQRGWVRQDEDRRYGLGSTMLRFGETIHKQLAAAARPYLQRVVVLTGETANLAVLEGDHVVYVDQVASRHRLRTFAEVGHRVPLHSTAVGKVLAAHLDGEEVRTSLKRAGLPVRTSLTITDLGRFEGEMVSVRRLGYAVDDGEEAEGIFCVAVPVGDPEGGALCALSISAPASRVSGAQAPGLSSTLRAVAGELASALAGRQPPGRDRPPGRSGPGA